MEDYVCPFSEDMPEAMLNELRPEILVKGGDYTVDQGIGREIVEKEAVAGETILLLHDGDALTGIIERILTRESLKWGERSCQWGRIHR